MKVSVMEETSYYQDLKIYIGRMKEFNVTDWVIYAAWVGMMAGLLFATGGFLFVGHAGGVAFPGYVWNILIGNAIFLIAIAVDTIGHRTVYKDELKKGEALIHHLTIASGVGSVVALCLAYDHSSVMRAPALVLTVLSFVYSLLDEGMHWIRYLTKKSDRIEMWSHFFILFGHALMMVSWWQWFNEGYQGVAETLRLF